MERRRKGTECTPAVYDCLDCGAEVRASLPEGRETSGYGPQVSTEIVLGKIVERLPYRKQEERLAREGIPSCPAMLQAVVWKAGERLKGEEAVILGRLPAAPWVHADESLFRIDGRRVWIWVFYAGRSSGRYETGRGRKRSCDGSACSEFGSSGERTPPRSSTPP